MDSTTRARPSWGQARRMRCHVEVNFIPSYGKTLSRAPDLPKRKAVGTMALVISQRGTTHQRSAQAQISRSVNAVLEARITTWRPCSIHGFQGSDGLLQCGFESCSCPSSLRVYERVLFGQSLDGSDAANQFPVPTSTPAGGTPAESSTTLSPLLLHARVRQVRAAAYEVLMPRFARHCNAFNEHPWPM